MRTTLGALLALPLALVLGCGSSNSEAHLSGRVTFRGEPVRGGRLWLKALQPGGRVEEVTGMIEPNGRYRITDVPLGEIGIGIDTRIVQQELVPQWPGSKESCPWVHVPIPAAFADPMTSGITTTIQAGREQSFDIVVEGE